MRHHAGDHDLFEDLILFDIYRINTKQKKKTKSPIIYVVADILGDCEFYMMRGTQDFSVILQAILCISDIINLLLFGNTKTKSWCSNIELPQIIM